MVNRQFLITTGDPDGIGYEVSAKALVKIASTTTRRDQFILFRSTLKQSRYRKLLESKYQVIEVPSFASIRDVSIERKRKPFLFEIVSDKSPAQWVREAAELCLLKRATALVTGPMSKSTGLNGASHVTGHTEILKSVTKSPHVFMGFVGHKFNVVLVTGHLPLTEVSGQLSQSLVEKATAATAHFCKALGRSKKPLAILGLNPHAGESSLIGTEEERVILPAIKSLSSRGINIVGPLVPDVAFFETSWSKYSAFIALYHDQGLIPFKMVHTNFNGAQISLGLPFVRTSVDHGTAKDIFGKNRANPNSMIAALKLAMNMCKV